MGCDVLMLWDDKAACGYGEVHFGDEISSIWIDDPVTFCPTSDIYCCSYCVNSNLLYLGLITALPAMLQQLIKCLFKVHILGP